MIKKKKTIISVAHSFAYHAYVINNLQRKEAVCPHVVAIFWS